MTALQELVRAYPDFALAHNDLGVLYSNTGEMEKALAHYEEAARLEPANVNIQKNLADLYHIVMGRTEEALQIYVKLLAVQPKDLEVLSALANLCLSLDRLDDAGYFFTRALEVEPWNAEIRQSLQALEAFSPSQPAPSAVTAESGSTGKECPAAGLAPEILALYGKKQQVLENAQIQPIDIIFLTYNRRDYFEKTIKPLSNVPAILTGSSSSTTTAGKISASTCRIRPFSMTMWCSMTITTSPWLFSAALSWPSRIPTWSATRTSWSRTWRGNAGWNGCWIFTGSTRKWGSSA
nr:tetratricopeptide repeat protein [Geotalea toluenoxydans]